MTDEYKIRGPVNVGNVDVPAGNLVFQSGCGTINGKMQMPEPIVTITAFGEVIVNPKFSMDEAAKAFWDAVKRCNPTSTALALTTVTPVDDAVRALFKSGGHFLTVMHDINGGMDVSVDTDRSLESINETAPTADAAIAALTLKLEARKASKA